MDDKPIVVFGFCRSGSSLLMQMLHAGGIEPAGDATYPSYEISDKPYGPGRDESLGKCVKLLYPPAQLSSYVPCTAILARRDLGEQAKSIAKWLRAMGQLKKGEPDAIVIPKLRDSLRRDYRQYQPLFQSNDNWHVVRFEWVLAHPRRAARHLADIVGLPLTSIDAMEACVRERSPDCYDGLLELEQIGE